MSQEERTLGEKRIPDEIGTVEKGLSSRRCSIRNLPPDCGADAGREQQEELPDLSSCCLISCRCRGAWAIDSQRLTPPLQIAQQVRKGPQVDGGWRDIEEEHQHTFYYLFVMLEYMFHLGRGVHLLITADSLCLASVWHVPSAQ